MENQDNFYEERYQQIKNDLFIGDEKHMLGKTGSFMFLYRLFEECFTFDEIFNILDNIRTNDLAAKEEPFVQFDEVTKMILKENKSYLVVDQNDKIKVDYWEGDKFRYTMNPKMVMLYAKVDNYFRISKNQ